MMFFTSTKRKRVNLARQNPLSYIAAMEKCVKDALLQADAQNDFQTADIIGIGIDATASTPVPVNANLKPLAALPEFADNLNAYAWMWKDHTSITEAERITSKAQEQHPEYL
jgi:L-ribulokinase